MNIAIIGTGNMGSALGTLLTQARHTVTFGSRDPQQPVRQAIEGAELVILAVPYTGAIALAEDPDVRTALAGKIVVDITNPLAPDFMSLTIGHTSSAAEEIARRLPEARLVKAFSTIFAEVLRAKAEDQKVTATVLVAGDDAQAKSPVLALASELGFSAVDTGALTNARYIEPLTELEIQLAYGQGRGSRITFQLVEV